MSIFKKLFGGGSKNSEPEKEEVVIQTDLDQGLERTKFGFFDKLQRAVVGKATVDEEVLDELENVLISSDVGLETTIKIIQRIETRVARDKYVNTSELDSILREEIIGLLSETEKKKDSEFILIDSVKPYVILVVGVNGVGKTTSIGKLAHKLKAEGKKVVLGAADTFRAAAVDQLQIWSERVGCDFYSKGMNADPAAVAYETIKFAQENNCDVAIIDTAGRLHNKTHLMTELTKIKNSISKRMETAPHEVILVLDASTGQNAFEQAKAFTQATNVNGLVLTKLDGTAKGGVVIGISEQFQIPIRFIGVGEAIHQLQAFNAKTFVEAFFKKK